MQRRFFEYVANYPVRIVSACIRVKCLVFILYKFGVLRILAVES